MDEAVEPRALVPAQASFEDLFHAHADGLFGALCLTTGDRVEAEEILQDAFLAMWERWDRVATMGSPAGYLYRTAFNLARRRFRRAALAHRLFTLAIPHRDPIEEADDRTLVGTALATLPPRQRMALVLSDLLGFTSAEAARVLGIRPATVRALASQARASMRRALGDQR